MNAVLDTIVETVANGDDVMLPGFGSFKSAQRAAREGKEQKVSGLAIQHPCRTFSIFSVAVCINARRDPYVFDPYVFLMGDQLLVDNQLNILSK